jgi:hypothetical protein
MTSLWTISHLSVSIITGTVPEFVAQVFKPTVTTPVSFSKVEDFSDLFMKRMRDKIS